jgi:hypothetical protein
LEKKNNQELGFLALGLQNMDLQVMVWVWVIRNNLLILVTDMEEKKEKDDAVCEEVMFPHTHQSVIQHLLRHLFPVSPQQLLHMLAAEPDAGETQNRVKSLAKNLAENIKVIKIK